MNWYNGNIAEAVTQSKIKNAIFVVYVEGKDETTEKLSGFIDELAVREKLESDDFVAVKIQSESEAYMQFASIYQMVPVPSIFFIGKSGAPLEIATGIIDSADELATKIVKVLELAGKPPTPSVTSSLSNEFKKQEQKVEETLDNKQEDNVEKQSVTEVICDGEVCYIKRKPLPEQEEPGIDRPTTSRVNEAPNSGPEKLEETRKYLEQRRRERVEEENRLEKERELKRRREGREMQNLRDWQQEQELKELKENMKRERLEEQAARERIRAQIAADKAERAHKFGQDSQPTTSQGHQPSVIAPHTAPPSTLSDESRLQFRLASGQSQNQTFKNTTTLAEVRDYVKNQVIPGTGIRDFILATTYPKREFTLDHFGMTLLELELFPSAVILVISKEAAGAGAILARSGGLLNMLSTILWAVLNPILAAVGTVKGWFVGDTSGRNIQTGAQKRASEEQDVQNDVAKRRNMDRFLSGNAGPLTSGNNNSDKPDNSNAATTYRRYVSGSNIHRLTDNRKDSDDENATWNGNSTQQQ
uniref:UBX domain-containing protein 4 n=1 Tax=Glossina morsitans morsitans TaxID=37546 RepID=D3TPU2_GLOMM